MGAPINALASCIGGCSALACCKLLECGSVRTTRGACVSLMFLQVFGILLAIAAVSSPEQWLHWPCAQLDRFGTVGVCECTELAEPGTCLHSQLTYRIQGAVIVMFALLFLLSCSGCAQGAA